MDVLPSFTIFDIAVVGVIALSALLALARGAVREVLGLASWIGAVFVALKTYAQARPFVATYIQEPLLADVATAILVFLLPLILFRIAASVIANLVSAASLGGLDRLLGLAFGVFRGALIVCAAYLVLSMLMVPERQPVWIQEAHLLPQVREGAFMLTRVLPENASLLGELVRPPEAPAAGEPASTTGSAEPGYTDEQRGNVDRLLAPKP